MPPAQVPTQALEKARKLLKKFRTRVGVEWKAFEIVDADKDVMSNYLSPYKLESTLNRIMELKVRLPCIVCQSHQGKIYCSVTYTSALNAKERIHHLKFLPIFYCVFYPEENVFYTTRTVIPETIGSSILETFRGTRINKLPLEGKDFESLRQLNQNRMNRGILFHRSVQDTHPLDLERAAHNIVTNDIIQNEDESMVKQRSEYFNKHFDPVTDPKMSKLTLSSKSRFSGLKKASALQCDLKVTIKSENLLNFINDSMNSGILSYPLNPYFENIVKMGRTSISIDSDEY